MCLDRITRGGVNRYESGIGLKVFILKGNSVYTIYKGANKPLPLNKWLDEKDYRSDRTITRIQTGIGRKNLYYHTGWHIYTEPPFVIGTDRSAVFLVEFKHTYAAGIELGKKIIVARYIKIIQRLSP
jgi:hypothetical protein